MEEDAARFDDLFFSLAQRQGFREYLTGLLAPRERNKTITCLSGAEPVTGAGMPAVQRLQFFLSESPWEAEQVNDRRLELLREQPATAPHEGGVLVIDDSGDRKDGTPTAHVGRQWLGRLGKTDNGIVTVTTVWTDGRVYYPLHATPYTPAHAGAGADEVIATAEENVATLVREMTDGEGARVIFDPVGGTALADLVTAAAHEAHIVLYGVLDRTPTPLNVGEVLFKHLTIRGFELFEITTDDQRRAEAVAFVTDGLTKGELTPTIDKTFPLEDIAEAHRYLEAGGQVGKIVVTVPTS